MNRRRFRIFPIIIILLLLLTVTGGLLFVLFITGPKRLIIGRFSRDIDISDGISDVSSDWLMSAAMGKRVELSGIKIALFITFDGNGNYNITVHEASYEDARQDAYTAFSDATRDLIISRFEASGISDTSEDAVDEKVNEVLGMSLQKYLEDYGPKIMPELSALKETYETSGTYRIEKNMIIFDDGKASYFLVNNELLTITDGENSEETYVYFRNE